MRKVYEDVVEEQEPNGRLIDVLKMGRRQWFVVIRDRN